MSEELEAAKINKEVAVMNKALSEEANKTPAQKLKEGCSFGGKSKVKPGKSLRQLAKGK